MKRVVKLIFLLFSILELRVYAQTVSEDEKIRLFLKGVEREEIKLLPQNRDVILINDYYYVNIAKEGASVIFNFIEDDVSGTIGGLDYSIQLDTQHIEKTRIQGTAKVDELDTDNFLRDGHLMWKKYFHENKYPNISFESTKIQLKKGRNFIAEGTLQIKGISKNVEIYFVLLETQLIGKTSINTVDFEINIHEEKEKNKVDIKFVFPIIKT